MAYYGDLCVSTGEYDGKKRWLKVGAVFENDKGLSIKMEAMPLAKQGNDGYPEVWLSIFKKDNQQQAPAQGFAPSAPVQQPVAQAPQQGQFQNMPVQNQQAPNAQIPF